MNRVLILSAILLMPLSCMACSFSEIEPLAPALPFVVQPKAPPTRLEQLIISIGRGERSGSSCNWLGEIVISLKPEHFVLNSSLRFLYETTGYEFEVIETNMGGTPAGFNAGPLVPTSVGEGLYSFAFEWGDGATDNQESIFLRINVYAVDRWMRRSSRCTVTIVHQGTGSVSVIDQAVSCENK
jgi:hypothetical protein